MYPSIQAKIWGNIGQVSDLLDMVLDSFIKVIVICIVLPKSTLVTFSSLVFCCFQQVSDMHSHLLSCLHHTLCLLLYCEILFSFHAVTKFAHIFPFVMSWQKFFLSYLFFLCQIVFNMLLVSLAHTKTSLSFTFSIQLILKIFTSSYWLSLMCNSNLTCVSEQHRYDMNWLPTPAKFSLHISYVWTVGNHSSFE